MDPHGMDTAKVGELLAGYSDKSTNMFKLRFARTYKPLLTCVANHLRIKADYLIKAASFDAGLEDCSHACIISLAPCVSITPA
eukprot:455955-Alexandrium_andersonii.AAC.1